MKGFKKGHTGSKPKGAKSHKHRDIIELCEDLGFEPLARLIEIADNPDTDTPCKVAALRAILPYLYVKPASRGNKLLVPLAIESLTETGKKVLESMGTGVITLEEAERIMSILRGHATLVEHDDLLARVERLELVDSNKLR